MDEQKELQKFLKQIGNQEVQKEVKQNLKQLQDGAKEFLKIVDQQVNLEESLDYIFYKNKNVAFSFQTIYKMMQRKTKITQILIGAQERFQAVKNKVNNINMILAYFDIDNNKIIISSQETMIKFLETYATVASKAEGRGDVRMSKRRYTKGTKKSGYIHLQQEEDSVYKQIQDILNQRSALYKKYFNEAQRRWKKEDMHYKKDEKLKNTFYWRPYVGTAQWYFINWSKPYGSRGPLAEGYIAALMNNAFHQGYLEDNINILNDYVSQTSNLGASKQQDIVINFNNQRVQVAVKSSRKFSTAAIGQYIKEALEIVGLEVFEEKGYLVDKINYTSVVDQLLKEHRQDALDEIIKKARDFIPKDLTI